MANDITAFRLPPEEKHALKILAAEADMTLTDYVLDVLRKHTALSERARLLALSIRDKEQNIPLAKRNPAQSTVRHSTKGQEA